MTTKSHQPTQHGKLKLATVLAFLGVFFILLTSLISSPQSSSLSSTLSPLSASWATFSPFTSNTQSGLKQVSIPSADGLLGDFIPDFEVRASQGALKSLGQKRTMKENLRDDKRYLMSWPVAGWNNQVICFMNLIYFAVRSGRIPILPDFSPHNEHLNTQSAPLLRFGQVFDVPRLSALLNTPLVEFSELKGNGQEQSDVDKWKYDDEFPDYADRVGEWVDNVEPDWEDIGCWSWAEATRLQDNQNGFQYSILQHNTPLPQGAIGSDWDHGIAIKPFIDLLKKPSPAWPELDEWQTQLFANHSDRIKLPDLMPDDDVACVDEMYFLDKTEMQSEVGTDALLAGIGPWNEVGRYMYFAPRLRAITHGYLRRAFGLAEDEKVPTYVAVHIRRGDFGPDWKDLDPLDYSFHVADVLERSKRFLGFLPERVVVMTDETDEEWLAQLKDLGWYHFDHVKEQTVEKYGPWYTTLIDGVALSEGVGLVGSRQSTMSGMAYQRIRTWHGGVGVLMYPGMQKAPKGYVYPYAPDAA